MWHDASAWIPVGSLLVTALAVFVGPMISLRIASKQIKTSLAVAHKQVISPMRQQWINSLRDHVAEFVSVAAGFYRARFDLKDESKWPSQQHSDSLRMILLYQQIELMLNPKEDEHNNLLKALEEVQSLDSSSDPDYFPKAVERVSKICRTVPKAEWERLKVEQ